MRIHFNKFMLDVHKSIHEIKSFNKKSKDYDPLTILADDLIQKVNLLFFDEFQVTDIADAMIMSRLFTALFDKGMVVFCTSNRIPNDLYKNGLQRELFEPFIDIIYQYCDVINLDSPIDYRKLSNISASNRVYFNSDFENHLLDSVINKLIGNNSSQGFKEMWIEVLGRKIKLERTHNRILETTFSFICEENRSSVDYLEFCKIFDVIIMKDIPFINMKHLDTLRRFIIFIDAVYDNRVKLIFSGKASTPQLLFDLSVKNFTLSKTDDASNKQHTSFIQEEYFAVDRTISRLIEMQSESYLDATKK
jgi:peroxisome-assembly ATPase